jgi:hypothetical protein
MFNIFKESRSERTIILLIRVFDSNWRLEMRRAARFSKFQRLNLSHERRVKDMDSFVFGEKMGLVAKIFGCRHKNLSRPFTRDKTSYRSCLNCGARKPFNAETLETYGKFYAPPAVKAERV